MKKALLVVACIWGAALISGCVLEEGLDGDNLVDDESLASNEDALVSDTPSATCGATKLLKNSTVRSGYGNWDSWGVLPAGTSVTYMCNVAHRTYLGNTYVYVKNPLTNYGWVLGYNVQ